MKRLLTHTHTTLEHKASASLTQRLNMKRENANSFLTHKKMTLIFFFSKTQTQVREALLRSVSSDSSHGKLFLARHLHRIAKNARRNERMEIASAAMCRLRCVVSDEAIVNLASREDWIRWEFEEAKCLWDRDERRRAMVIGKRLCHSISQEEKSSSLRTHLLLTTGSWLAETRSEASAVIHREYFATAARNALRAAQDKNQTQSEVVARASFRAAQYVDSLYRKLLSQVNSSEWQNWRKVKEKLEEEIRKQESLLSDGEEGDELDEKKKKKKRRKKSKTSSKKTKDVETLKARQKYIRRLRKKLDSLMRGRMADYVAVERYLIEAIGHYRECLKYSDAYDTPASSRLIAIMFDLSKKEQKKSAGTWCSNDAMKEVSNAVLSLPCAKFIPLIHQIVSRLRSCSTSETESSFRVNLSELVYQSGSKHPHHTLPVVAALCGGDDDDEETKNENVTAVSNRLARLSSLARPFELLKALMNA